MKKYILALDQGTTSSRSIVFDQSGGMVSMAQMELKQIYPKPGWVEHDPKDIWETQLETVKQAVDKANIRYDEVACIGITNQRETTIVWDKHTGEPVCNAVVWQCRRTSKLCEQLKAEGMEGYIKENTGLVIDPYFSATKIKWILDNVPNAKDKAEAGDLLFGTVDTWLLWNLTGGEKHMTDYTNASRTMLFNIKKKSWDENILKALNIPVSMLPKVCPSSYLYGFTHKSLFKETIPVAGMAGDQQSALFGQACFLKGDVKNTYGTGCFLLMNTGKTPVYSKLGLLTTICASCDDDVQYALEGSVFTAGAVIKWLRDELSLISSAAESEKMAMSVQDSNGVVLVPAFTGLGAPYWDSSARGTITGITAGVNKNHIVRAALESIALQSVDVINLMTNESNIIMDEIKVDGGASANNFLMQFQADVAQVNVKRPKIRETTALGAAYLAGISTGLFKKSDIRKKWKSETIFRPKTTKEYAEQKYKVWIKAVQKSMDRCK